MPELPEVETVMRGLAPVMEGEKINEAVIRRDGLRWPFPANFSNRLTGKCVIALRRRSKYILVELDSDETLIIHLGMSGKFLILNDKPFPELAKHDHVILQMGNDAEIRFSDPRRFGMMDLSPTSDLETHRLLMKIGPEPFSNRFNTAYLLNKFHQRKSAIKTALLDQSIVAGLGNIYVCEVLFRAKIHPLTPANCISETAINQVVSLVRAVLQEAIASGGSSLKDYRQADGDLGYFQHRFQVYGREKQPCVNQECDATICRINQAGRSSFFCPNCQSDAPARYL